MFGLNLTSPSLLRRGKAAALGIAAGLALAAVPGTASAQATVGDPSAAVAAGTTAADWYAGVKKGNWKETQTVSPGMHQIMTQALLDFSSYEAKGCKAAAANNAWGALADAANAGPLDAFLKAMKDAVVNIYKIAEFGADPEEAAEWLDADKLSKDYLDKLQSGAEDEAKQRVKDKLEEIWKGKPVEVLKRTSSRGGCDRTLISIWDRATSSYEITVYGNCHCSPVALFGGGTWRVNSYSAQLKGRAVPAVTSDGTLVLNVASPTIVVRANCNCGAAGDPKTANPPAGGGSVTPPTDGGSTVPPKRDGDFWRELTTSCPECKNLVDKIHAAQAARDDLDQSYRQANEELRMATRENDKAGIEAANAKLQDLYKRDATLVKLEEQFYAELKDCEAAKCRKGAGGTGGMGPCVPKAPPLPPCPGEEDKRTGYLPDNAHGVPAEAFAAFRTGDADASGTMVAVVSGHRHDLTRRTREDAFTAMDEARRTDGWISGDDQASSPGTPPTSGPREEAQGGADTQVEQPQLSPQAAFRPVPTEPSVAEDAGVAGTWRLADPSSGASQVTIRKDGSSYVLSGLGHDIRLEQAGSVWFGEGAELFGLGGHSIRLIPQGDQIRLEAHNSMGGTFTTLMTR